MSEKEIIQQIDRYLKGELTEREKDDLWALFLEHPQYLEWFEIEVSARNHFKNVANDTPAGPVEVSEAVRPSGHWYRYFAAAVALLILGGVAYIIIPSGEPTVPPALSDIDIQEMVTPDILRSGDREADPADVGLNAGYEAAVSGRTDESIRRFDAILQGNPSAGQAAAANLNKAILLYNRGEYEQASELLQQVAVADSLLAEKALWFLANAQLQSGDDSAASATLTDLSARKGAHSEDARNLLEQLGR